MEPKNAGGVNQFVETIRTLVARARTLLSEGKIAAFGDGKPEEATKARLLVPFLEALGYLSEYRTPEGRIRSLKGTTEWVDYYLLPDEKRSPLVFVEAKDLFETDLWKKHSDQITDYLNHYSQTIGRDDPVKWILLTNFAEWHFLFLSDNEPFWSFTLDDLEDTAPDIFDRLARENLSRNRLLEFYSERESEALGARFLADLKLWRLLLANGIRSKQADLGLSEVRLASQQMLNRLIFTRLLEAFGQEPYYSLVTVYNYWQSTSRSLSFSHILNSTRFKNSWVNYNTELFREGLVDKLDIPHDYFEPIILKRPILSDDAKKLLGSNAVKSLYNYDFTTIRQDILGMVYEQFLAHELREKDDGLIVIEENPETRKREGIYYTPDYIVKRIVRQTLQPRIGTTVDSAIEEMKAGRTADALRIVESVFSIRVVDPACGSGSFLLAAFDYIAEELERYNRAVTAVPAASTSSGPSGNLFSLMRPLRIDAPDERVLVNCLYGVDLDAEAVGLAKLSLWTKLLRRNPGLYGVGGEKEHSHLPALTLNIRQGNSLIDSRIDPRVHADAIARFIELEHIAKDVGRKHDLRISAAAELESGIESERLKADVALTVFFESEQEVSSRHPFNWQLEFPDVFDMRRPIEQQGFQVVIGNPPYYNVDSRFGSGAPELSFIKARYADIYTDKTDILFYFIRRGIELLAANGDLAFIVSRAFIQADKAVNLRRFLAAKTTLIEIMDFLGNRVFRAGIATAILHCQKGLPDASHGFVVRCVLDFEKVRQALKRDLGAEQGLESLEIRQADLKAERWEFSPFKELFRQIDDQHKKLREIAEAGQGMQTGLNPVFVLDKSQVQAAEIPPEYLKKRASTENLYPYGVADNGESVLWVEDRSFDSLPEAVKKYLKGNQTALKERAAFLRGNCEWYKFTWTLHADLHFRPKIMAPYRSDANTFTVDERGEWIGLTNTTHVFFGASAADPFAICALLNSSVLEFRYRALGGLGKLTGTGMFEYFENQIGDLPIPEPKPETEVDWKKLGQLGREAHLAFNEKMALTAAYSEVIKGLNERPLESLAVYLNPADPIYSTVVVASSPSPQLEAHLFKLRMQIVDGGFVILGQVGENEDPDEGEREWVPISIVEVKHDALRQILIARLLELTELDPHFRGKRKLSGRTRESVLSIMKKSLTVPVFDPDPKTNLAIVETVFRRVQEDVGRNDLDKVLLQQFSNAEAIEAIALKLYGVEDQQAFIQSALKVTL